MTDPGGIALTDCGLTERGFWTECGLTEFGPPKPKFEWGPVEWGPPMPKLEWGPPVVEAPIIFDRLSSGRSPVAVGTPVDSERKFSTTFSAHRFKSLILRHLNYFKLKSLQQ